MQFNIPKMKVITKREYKINKQLAKDQYKQPKKTKFAKKLKKAQNVARGFASNIDDALEFRY